MNEIRRFYNLNRKKIWSIIILIIIGFIILQLSNYIAYMNIQKRVENAENQEEVDNTIKYNTENSTLVSEKSAVNKDTKSSRSLKNATETINKFVEACNNKQFEQAYNLLTQECKEEMYDNVDIFVDTYYKPMFVGEDKICTIENWVNNTYMVTIKDSPIITGNSRNSVSKMDYMTVVKVDDEYKLNINSYIGYTPINKEKDENNIKIQVIGKHTYMTYEKYKFKVYNNTNFKIILDSLEDSETLYLKDTEGCKYKSYNHELTDVMMEVNKAHTREFSVKFYSAYVSTKKIDSIVFYDLKIMTPNIKSIEYKIDI